MNEEDDKKENYIPPMEDYCQGCGVYIVLGGFPYCCPDCGQREQYRD